MAIIDKKFIHFKKYDDFISQAGVGSVANITTPTSGSEDSRNAVYGQIKGSSIVFIKDTKQIWTHGQLYNCSEFSIPITYAELRTLHDKGELSPGQKYRITDYETITCKSNTQSAGHNFDIIVQAIDNKTLSHDAKAAIRQGDSYFENSKLESWKLQYDLVPDSSKYDWIQSDVLEQPAKWKGDIGILDQRKDGENSTNYITKQINEVTKYLYKVPNNSDFWYYLEFYTYETNTGVSSLDEVIVATLNDPESSDWSQSNLVIVKKSTGEIINTFYPTYYWSTENVGFDYNPCDSEYEECEYSFDMRYTYETASMNGQTYYLWEPYDSDIGWEDYESAFIGGGTRQYFEGSYDSLYYVLDSPLYVPEEEDDSYICDVTAVYSSDTDTVYTNFYSTEWGEEVYEIDSIYYTKYQPLQLNSKGVIYRMIDDFRNDLPFDFKNIQNIFDGNTYQYVFQSSRVKDSSLDGTCRNNRVSFGKTSTLQPILFTKTCVNNDLVVQGKLHIKSSLTDCSIVTTGPLTINLGSLVNSSIKGRGQLSIDSGVLNLTTSELKLLNSYDSLIQFKSNTGGTKNISYLTLDASGCSSDVNIVDISQFLTKKYPISIQFFNSEASVWCECSPSNGVIRIFDSESVMLSPGHYYKQQNPHDRLEIKLDQTFNGIQAGEYDLEFTTSENGTSLIIPAMLKFIEGRCPIIEPNTTYYAHIVNDVCTIASLTYYIPYMELEYITTDRNTLSLNQSAISNSSSIMSNIYEDIGVITFNKPLENIKEYAFTNCSSLTDITMPDSVTSIGKYAFRECTSLTSITIPNRVTSIGDWAFYNCTSLTRVDISDLSAWCKISFGDYYANPLYYAEKLYLNGSELTDITIPSDITEIKDYAFYNCTSLTSITIPESVTLIGKDAFYGCTSLTSITIPDSVTKIGYGAFNRCKLLTNVTIPNSVTSLGGSTFRDCTSLTSATIGSGVTSMGAYEFSHCSGLTDVTISDGINKIGDYMFEECPSLTNAAIPNSVTSIGSSAFGFCKSLTSVTIPDSVTSIGYYAFRGCDSLTTIYGKFASEDNRCLIVDGVLNSFAPAGLTEYTIPNSVTTIGRYSFYKCTPLPSIIIPNNVTKIDVAAFLQCSNLTSVYCQRTTPPTGSNYMFDGNALGRKIYVPYQSIDAYKSATSWSNYAADIVGYNFEKGKVIINFSIDGGNLAPAYTSKYQAEEGMTFGEWVDSDYNNKGLISSGNQIMTPGGKPIMGISTSDIIVADHIYIIYDSGGSD